MPWPRQIKNLEKKVVEHFKREVGIFIPADWRRHCQTPDELIEEVSLIPERLLLKDSELNHHHTIDQPGVPRNPHIYFPRMKGQSNIHLKFHHNLNEHQKLIQ